jgi:hypothetical protein
LLQLVSESTLAVSRGLGVDLQLLFRKPITKNSKVKRSWLGAMGDRPGSPSRVRMSEDKVRRKDMCWSVGIFLGS